MKKILALLFTTLLLAAAHAQSFTPNINLAVPPQGYPNWANIINGNWTKIDTAVGALQNGFQGAWNTTVTYSKGQSVTYNGSYYFSIVNSNQGNLPSAVGSTFWTQVTVSTSVTGNANLFYATPNGASGAASLRAMLNADLPQSLDVPSVRGATINGEITVDGTTYTSLNSAWTAAVSAATSTGQNQTIRLGPGQYNVTATLVEPTNGACVSLIGSAKPTITAASTQAATVINVPSNLSGDLFDLLNTSGTQAQSCNFTKLVIMGNKNIAYAFNLQWFRGLYISGVTINDTTAAAAIQLGEAANTGHQSNYKLVDVTISYSTASFTPATRPNYGLWAMPTAIDSEVNNLLVRNALQAAFFNQGSGTTAYLIHGLGFPYTCTTAPCSNTESNPAAADASYASNFVVIDIGGGGNQYFSTYVDSPAESGFNIESNGVQVNGGHIQWPDTTSFPKANLAWVQNTVTSNTIIANVGCSGMSPTAGDSVVGAPAGTSGWITYFLNNGNAPSYSFVFGLAGCSNYYQSRQSATNTAYDVGGTSSSNLQQVTPKVYVTPAGTGASNGGVEVENPAGGQGDAFYSGFNTELSNFAVRASGSIHTIGGLETGVQAVSSATTLTSDVRQVLADASAAAFTLTLPSCAATDVDGLNRTGLELVISKTDTSANAVTLQAQSSQLIYNLGAGAGTYTISAASSYTLFCGTDNNWYVNSGYTATSASGITNLTGDATSSGGPSAAVTVVGINGVSLAGLGAGLLKQNASGVPSIAGAGTDYVVPGSTPTFAGLTLTGNMSGTGATFTGSVQAGNMVLTGGQAAGLGTTLQLIDSGTVNSQLVGLSVEQTEDPSSTANYYNFGQATELYTPLTNSQAFPSQSVAVYGSFSHFGLGALNAGYGGSFEAFNSGPATATLIVGVSGIGNNGGVVAGLVPPQTPTNNGNATNVWGGDFITKNLSSGTITNAEGIHIEAAQNTDGGVITNNYGLVIDDQTAGVNNYAIVTGVGKLQFGGVATFYSTVDVPSLNFGTPGAYTAHLSSPSGDVVNCNNAADSPGTCTFEPGAVLPGIVHNAATNPLPTCNSFLNGEMRTVNDATAPLTYMAQYVGGGTITAQVTCSDDSTTSTYVWKMH